MHSDVASKIPLILFTLRTVSSSVTWDTSTVVVIHQIIACSVVLARAISTIIHVCEKEHDAHFLQWRISIYGGNLFYLLYTVYSKK